MNIATYTKEAGATADFPVDWSVWLGTRTISSSEWNVEPSAGITIESESNTATTATIRLSSGTWGQTYIATNTITASDGEVEENSITIKIQQEQKYCTTLEVRRRAQGGSGSGGSATTTALPEAELEALIEQASRMFDLECGVPPEYFNPPAYPFATEQTIYGNGTNYLRLPPFVPGTLDTDITLPDGYTAPSFVEQGGFLILTTTSGLLPPFAGFMNSYWTGWYAGVAVTVSAIWGYRETPADVRMAVIELVLNLHRETDPASVKLVGLEGQPLRERMPPRVLQVAKKYKFQTGAVFV